MQSSKVKALIEAFSKLPTIGPKTAQRLAFNVLEHNRGAGAALGGALLEAVEHVGHCTRCRNFAESELCEICVSPRRNAKLLCVVEHASDIAIIEQSHLFDGHYFVLMGKLSPIDGVGPDELGLEKLDTLLDETVEEVILATSGSVEGEVTAQYIANMAQSKNIKATRLAQGVPVGGELEYLDGSTLAHAFNGRKQFD